MLKRSSARLVIIVAVIMAAGLALGLPRVKDERQDAAFDLERFATAYRHIVLSYVDDVDSELLVDKAIEAMVDELDAFSVVMDEDRFEDLMVRSKQEFGGLGIVISIRDDYPTVISPIEDTPAARLGIRGGDRIEEIEGVNTQGWKTEDAVDKLRGEVGTEVTIGIRRFGVEELLPFTIRRDIIDVASVPYHFMLDGDIGYVRCSTFGEKTADEMWDAVKDLEDQGIKGLVVDLRGNPGGLLDAAQDVTDIFLEPGRLIVSTRMRGGVLGEERFAGGGRKKAGDYPLVVLINESSASASEIFAGAVQDWDRGLVVGRNSFGKGSVQSLFPLADREALKLTTAKYYTPSGRCIHRDEYNMKHDPAQGDTLRWEDMVSVPLESLPAYDTRRLARTVRGGGGIMPDLIVEYDELSDLALDLERRAAFFSFAVQLAAEEDVTLDFQAGEAELQKFRQFLTEREIEWDEESFVQDEDYIASAIRRELFTSKFSAADAYRSTMDQDKTLQEAVRLLRLHPTLDGLLAAAESPDPE